MEAIRRSCRYLTRLTAHHTRAIPEQIMSTPVYDQQYYDTRIDCAAIKTHDGKVWTGKRHGHCFQTIKQAYGMRSCEVPGEGQEVQGFVTCSGKFVDRREAASLVRHTKQVPDFDAAELYSEDLY